MRAFMIARSFVAAVLSLWAVPIASSFEDDPITINIVIRGYDYDYDYSGGSEPTKPPEATDRVVIPEIGLGYPGYGMGAEPSDSLYSFHEPWSGPDLERTMTADGSGVYPYYFGEVPATSDDDYINVPSEAGPGRIVTEWSAGFYDDYSGDMNSEYHDFFHSSGPGTVWLTNMDVGPDGLGQRGQFDLDYMRSPPGPRDQWIDQGTSDRAYGINSEGVSSYGTARAIGSDPLSELAPEWNR